jgi:hypothetical protein
MEDFDYWYDNELRVFHKKKVGGGRFLEQLDACRLLIQNVTKE